MRTLMKLLATLVIASMGLMAVIVALAPAAHALFTAGSAGGPSDVLTLGDLPERSQVFDAAGNLMTTFHAEENRDPVTFSEVPPSVVNAILDTEDAKFWDHHGVNPWATARALFSNASAGGIKQGGSTITQQLVKNTLLTNERTVSRKIKEAVLAVRLENELSKQQILERYLNTVYFGNGAYGIKTAAEVYFGVDVKQLTRIQGALLAGMINNPDGEDPFRFPERAKARRDFVLDRMAANGDLTKTEADAGKVVPLPTKRVVITPPPDGQDSYFVEEVKQRLLSEPTLGDTPQARYNAVFRGGLKIYTTLDPAMQQSAKQSIADHLPDENGTWTGTLVSIDTKSGAVRALVGGPGFDRSQYRIATEGPGRQPGSSFKPIVLAAALKKGYNIHAGVDGTTPCAFPNPGSPDGPYVANNTESNESGYFDLTSALAYSVNCAYVRLGLAVGLQNVVDMARALGIETPLHAYPSISLGAQEARPIDMAGVYATFANDGVHHRPFLVDHIVDRTGKVVFKGGDKPTQVLSPAKAHEELVALRAVMTQPGATGLSAALDDREAAGKTGTSEHNENAWFDGVTPQLTTVVWMGSPIGNVPMTYPTPVCGTTASGTYVCPGTVFGATIPAPIWREFMTKALAGQAAVPFPDPDPHDLGNIFSVTNPTGSFNPGGATGPNGYVGPNGYGGTNGSGGPNGYGNGSTTATTSAPGGGFRPSRKGGAPATTSPPGATTGTTAPGGGTHGGGPGGGGAGDGGAGGGGPGGGGPGSGGKGGGGSPSPTG